MKPYKSFNGVLAIIRQENKYVIILSTCHVDLCFEDPQIQKRQCDVEEEVIKATVIMDIK